MPRAVLALVVASIALATPLTSGANVGAAPSGRAVTGEITLRAKFHQGPWKKSLYLKLVKLRLIDIQFCAIWNHPAGSPFDCDAAAKDQLPAGTIMRLEQSPIAKAVRRPESPGWGMLGASQNGALGAIVSNLLSGNRRGTFHYRVTLRDRSSNQVLATSNTFTVVWH